MNVHLNPPKQAELVGIAAKICMHDEAAAKVLAKFGCDQGNIRSMAKTYREAQEMAEDGRPSATNIQDAIRIIGGV